MLGFILFISLGGAWAAHHFIRDSWTPFIAVTRLPVPLAFLAHPDMWHRSFCQPTPSSPCREVKRTKISQDDMDKLVSRKFQDRVRARTATYLAEAEAYQMLDHWEIAYFDCCWKGSPWEKGFVLAESADFLVTWEISDEELARRDGFDLIRIAGINKRHCLAPPMIPFGRIVQMGSRSYATWPDHNHFWIEHFDAPHGRVGPREVGVWDRSEQPWRPKVTYDILTVARRLVTTLPVYTFSDEALRMARSALKLPSSRGMDKLGTNAIHARLSSLMNLVTTLHTDIDSNRLGLDSLGQNVNDLDSRLNQSVKDSVAGLRTDIATLRRDLSVATEGWKKFSTGAFDAAPEPPDLVAMLRTDTNDNKLGLTNLMQVIDELNTRLDQSIKDVVIDLRTNMTALRQDHLATIKKCEELSIMMTGKVFDVACPQPGAASSQVNPTRVGFVLPKQQISKKT